MSKKADGTVVCISPLSIIKVAKSNRNMLIKVGLCANTESLRGGQYLARVLDVHEVDPRTSAKAFLHLCLERRDESGEYVTLDPQVEITTTVDFGYCPDTKGEVFVRGSEDPITVSPTLRIAQVLV